MRPLHHKPKTTKTKSNHTNTKSNHTINTKSDHTINKFKTKTNHTNTNTNTNTTNMTTLSYLDTLPHALSTTISPPYSIILDTNFINFTIRRKIDLQASIRDCVLANFTLYVPECVIGELEKLGKVFRVALKIIKEGNMTERLCCDHRGTYADDCIVSRVKVARCYVVATCDTGLKQRIRKIGGVPLMYLKGKKVVVERLPGR